jgi:hypothetical protein
LEGVADLVRDRVGGLALDVVAEGGGGEGGVLGRGVGEMAAVDEDLDRARLAVVGAERVLGGAFGRAVLDVDVRSLGEPSSSKRLSTRRG